MKKNNKGFTIVELVIVIAVIGILAAVLIPTFSGIIENAKESSDMQNAKNAYTTYLAGGDNNAANADRMNTFNFEITSGDHKYYVTAGVFGKDKSDNVTYTSVTIEHGTLKIADNTQQGGQGGNADAGAGGAGAGGN